MILILRLELFCALFMLIGEEDEGLHEGMSCKWNEFWAMKKILLRTAIVVLKQQVRIKPKI